MHYTNVTVLQPWIDEASVAYHEFLLGSAC